MPANGGVELRAEEFQDYRGSIQIPHRLIDRDQLLNAATLRGVAALVVGIVVLVVPESDRVFGLLIAAVVVFAAVGELIGAVRSREGRWSSLVRGVALLTIVASLVVWPNITRRVVSRIVGLSLVATGGVSAYRVLLKKPPLLEGRRWRLTRAGFMVVLGVVVITVPGAIFEFVLIALAVTWILGGLSTIVTNLRTDTEEQTDLLDTGSRFLRWLEGRPHTADDRTQLYGKLFFEGPDSKRRLSRFYLLMAFASVIAAYGVATDSTAVVVGAMLVAPLMTPLMATCVAIVMGWPKRATLSAMVAVSGIVLAVGVGFMAGAGLTFELSALTNTQIAGRINPTLLDLLIAVAAGGAGAFALSRPDVSDALPGVAVSIALVPPLVVAGLMLEAGDIGAALGSLLLFMTNLVAILLAGGVVFVLTGIVPLSLMIANRAWIRSTLTLVATVALLVVGVLALSGQRIQTEAFDQDEATEALATWIDGSDLEVFSLDISGSKVAVVVVGSDDPPPVEDLGVGLEVALDREVDLNVRWIPETTLTYQTNG